MSVGPLDVFFGEMSIHVYCPFLNWIICFGGVKFDKFFIDFGYQPFIRYVICKYLLPFSRLPFSFVDCFFCCSEGFYFDVAPIVYFAFVSFTSGDLYGKKKFLRPMSYYCLCSLLGF